MQRSFAGRNAQEPPAACDARSTLSGSAFPLVETGDPLRKSGVEIELKVMDTGDELYVQTEAFAATGVTLTEDAKDLEFADDLLDTQAEAGRGAVSLFFVVAERVLFASLDRQAGARAACPSLSSRGRHPAQAA